MDQFLKLTPRSMKALLLYKDTVQQALCPENAHWAAEPSEPASSSATMLQRQVFMCDGLLPEASEHMETTA
jgi:hypothetical protein